MSTSTKLYMYGFVGFIMSIMIYSAFGFSYGACLLPFIVGIAEAFRKEQ